MNCISTRLPYRQAKAFSGIILDYLDHTESLKPFFANPATLQGIQKAVEARMEFPTNREVLVQELEKQYKGIAKTDKVKANIASLLSPATFTVTTAHQNNIFTGPLYFIYKIVHAIKLAAHLNESLTAYHFVPVYYIGSEDADIDELNHIHLEGEKIVWNTKQTGAVGRMKVDKALIKLIDQLQGQLSVLPYGDKIIGMLNTYYKEGVTIQDATCGLVNALFAQYGLIVLQPDNAALKKQMTTLFEDELLNQTASGIVEKTALKLEAAGYKVQAHARDINLFYLKDNMRERIEAVSGEWRVVSGSKRFSKGELLEELATHPERFSPNVILRGLYQETILPNIAFIGGGGETAYWLQLKDLFEYYKVPFPVLVLRNSFLIVEKKWQEKISKLGFTIEDIFLPEQELLNRLVARETNNKLQLNGTFSRAEQLYEVIKEQAASIDITLAKHVDALKLKTVQRLQELEKKMLRAEKRKFTAQQHQIHVIKEKLFPKNGLQERVDNMMPYYSKWGEDFIQVLYEYSLNLEQEFVVLNEIGSREPNLKIGMTYRY